MLLIFIMQSMLKHNIPLKKYFQHLISKYSQLFHGWSSNSSIIHVNCIINLFSNVKQIFYTFIASYHHHHQHCYSYSHLIIQHTFLDLCKKRSLLLFIIVCNAITKFNIYNCHENEVISRDLWRSFEAYKCLKTIQFDLEFNLLKILFD